MVTHSRTYLENPMDRGAWWATVHGVTESWTRLSMHTHMQGIIRKCFLCNIGLLMRKVELFFVGHSDFLIRGSNVKTTLSSWIMQKQGASRFHAVCSLSPSAPLGEAILLWVLSSPAHPCLACQDCKTLTDIL